MRRFLQHIFNRVDDCGLATIVLFCFSLVSAVGVLYVTSAEKWQRYEVHIVKTGASLTCDSCGKARYANNITNIFIKLFPDARYSMLYPHWSGRGARLISYSFFSNKEIELNKFFKEVLRYDNCASEFVRADFREINIEEWSRRHGSRGECKIFFIYERKL